MFQYSQFDRAEAVVISSTDHTLARPSCIWVGTGGASNTLKVLTKGGDTVTFTSLLSGTLVPVYVTKVFKTGTDVSNMMALS